MTTETKKTVISTSKLKPSISFQDNGAPYSEAFNDIYFDTESGCQQSQTVFIDGNNLSQRFATKTDILTIAETGFGTGLNFLLTLQAYHHCSFPNKPQLHFISVEKYPLTKQQLAQSLALWPQLKDFITPLLNQYPDDEYFDNLTAESSSIDLTFAENKIKLTLYFDDAAHCFAKLMPKKHRHSKQTKLVDAWFLDGFSPTKNPDMWSQALFDQIGRLSKPQATISTFTVAGFVRRGLQAVGFRLKKSPSQGKKKEILTGVFQQDPHLGRGYQLRPIINKPQHVTIIGGGIASACTAYTLTQKGIKVSLYCQDEEVAQGASSNAIGALYPLIHQNKDNISLFYQQAFNYARNYYQDLYQQGYHFAHDWCGLLEISYKEALVKRQQIFIDEPVWPKALIQSLNSEQASQKAGISLKHGGLFIPNAGWISPPELVKALLTAAQATNRLKIKNNCQLNQLSQQADETWLLNTNKGEFTASTLVVCAGAESSKLNIIDQLPLQAVRGQVTNLRANNPLKQLNTVICHKGYLTPNYQDIQCIGATFDKDRVDQIVDQKSDIYNLNMLKKCLPELALWQQQDINSSKARLRCMTPDHWPMVGPMPDITRHQELYQHLAKDKNWRYQTPAPIYNNLYVLTGLGARGLCTAPILAEILAADLTAEPYPVDSEQLFNLSPNRFVIRDLIKRKVMLN